MRHFALALGLIALGCSSNVADTTVSPDQGCSELATTYCDKANSCASLYISVSYGDTATCVSRFKTSCLAGLQAPSTAQTPGDLSACAGAAKSMSCQALFDGDLPTQCQPKAGGLDDGKSCFTDSQCKSSFCALDNEKAVCGVCAAKPAAGGKCVSNACPAPLKCSTDGTCNKPVAVGAACSGSIPCQSGSNCFGMKCVADATTEGAACNAMTGPSCDGTKGLACVTNKCVKFKVAATGADCGIDYDATAKAVTGATICEKGGWCKGVDLTAMPPVFKGKCEPAAKDGEACIESSDLGKGPGCMEPAECVSGKCQLSDNATCK